MHCKTWSIKYVMYVYGLCLFYLLLHLATIFYHLVAKWRLNNLFNFEPCEGFSAQVLHNGQRTQLLNMRTGVRQACLLSPLLFLVALDWVTKTAFNRKGGIQWTFTTSLEDLDFANNLALLSHRKQDMRDR